MYIYLHTDHANNNQYMHNTSHDTKYKKTLKNQSYLPIVFLLLCFPSCSLEHYGLYYFCSSCELLLTCPHPMHLYVLIIFVRWGCVCSELVGERCRVLDRDQYTTGIPKS